MNIEKCFPGKLMDFIRKFGAMDVGVILEKSTVLEEEPL